MHSWGLKLLKKSDQSNEATLYKDDGQHRDDYLGDDYIERFLVEYMQERRNPLSAAAAIISAIDEEIVAHDDVKRHIRPAQVHDLGSWV